MQNIYPIRTGIGDAGAPNDDASYGGVTADDSQLQSIRVKITEFQKTMDAFDAALQSADELLAAGDISDSLRSDLQQMLIDADSKRAQMRVTAETINAGVSSINYLGGRMPELSIPTGLGFIPILIPAAMAAAVAAVASLGYFAAQWIKGYNDRLKSEMLLNAQATPEAKAALAVAMSEGEQAQQLAESQGIFGGSSTVASVVKWAAIAGVAYFAWQAYEKHRKS